LKSLGPSPSIFTHCKDRKWGGEGLANWAHTAWPSLSLSLSLDLQATQIRLALAKIYEEEQQWRLSAEVLCGIPMDSGQK